MAIEAPTDDYKGSYSGCEAGRYHAIMREFDENGGDRGEAIVVYEIVTGTIPGQEGCLHKDYMGKSGKAFSRFHTLAIALGMTTNDEVKAKKERGESAVYDFEEQIGKHLFIELEEDEYEGKTRVKLGFGMFHPSSPKVRTWPRNEKAMKAAGYDIGAAVEVAPKNPSKGKPADKPAPNADDLF